jgi:hypothetical protein
MQSVQPRQAPGVGSLPGILKMTPTSSESTTPEQAVAYLRMADRIPHRTGPTPISDAVAAFASRARTETQRAAPLDLS